MAHSSYTCPGCRQALLVASSDGEQIIETCPVRECQRTIWIRGAADGGFAVCTDQVPDLTIGRFVIDGYRLLDNGAELLTGPTRVLEPMANMLNTVGEPTDAELVKLVRTFIQEHGAGCIFSPGYALVMAGSRAKESERT